MPWVWVMPWAWVPWAWVMPWRAWAWVMPWPMVTLAISSCSVATICQNTTPNFYPLAVGTGQIRSARFLGAAILYV